MRRKALYAMALSMALTMGSVVPAFAAPANENLQVMPISANVQVSLTQEDKDLLMDMFDAEYYASRYPDVAKALGGDKASLFEHFLAHGLSEGRQVNKDFNVNAYRSSYKDLNAVYGKDIMSYYRHFQNFGKVENRTITTVEKAQQSGIIVSDFAGEHMAVGANGAIVRGKMADVVIATNPVYANAVDNVGNTTRAEIASSVGVTSNVVLNDEETETKETETKKETVTSPSKDTPTIITIFDAENFAKAHKEWEENEPQPIDFSISYRSAHSSWMDSKPNKNDYVVDGKYATKEAAESAFAKDHSDWIDAQPVLEDYMSENERTAFDKAVADHALEEPKVEDYTYGDNKFESQEAADAAKEIAIASYEKYLEEKEAYDEKKGAMQAWETKDKSEYASQTGSKYFYNDTEYATEEEAIAAAEAAGGTGEDVVQKFYVVGKETNLYETQDAALTQAKEDNKPEDPGEEPDVVNEVNEAEYKYYKYKTEAEADEQYNNDYVDWFEKQPLPYDYLTKEETDEFEKDYKKWEESKPDIESDEYSWSNGAYESQTDADENYVSDMESWGEAEPDASSEEYSLTEEEQRHFDDAHENWEYWEPKKEDFTCSYDSKEFGSCVG